MTKIKLIGLTAIIVVCCCACAKERAINAILESSEEISESPEKLADDEIQVTDVSWEADHINNAIISFKMSDGTVQELDTGLAMDVQSMEMCDIDNDGADDEYVIHGYFANTLGENYPIYVYKLEDDTVKQIFPNEELEDLKDEPVFNAELDKTYDETLNTIKVTVQDKVEGIVYEKLSEEVYCKDGKWQVSGSVIDPNAAYQALTKPRSVGDFSMDETTRELYSGFMGGTVKASYDADGDLGGYICLSDVLKNGEEATLDEIIEKLTAEGQYAEGMTVESRRDSYIDCGLDGNPEMLVTIQFNSEFSLQMLIKNISGKLVISACSNTWSRCETNYKMNGVITSLGSGGANIHGGKFYYVDANGKAHFWYDSLQEGVSKYEGKFDYNGLQVELPEEIEFMYVNEICFDKDKKDSSEKYYQIALSEADNEMVKGEAVHTAIEAFNEAGCEAKTDEEIDSILEKHRNEIGLTDEIYNYGNEYLVEE